MLEVTDQPPRTSNLVGLQEVGVGITDCVVAVSHTHSVPSATASPTSW